MYTLKNSSASDADYIYQVVKTTMYEYAIQTWGVWLEKEAKEDARTSAAEGKVQIVYVDQSRVGILLVSTDESQIVVKQIYVMPAFQNQGIGTAIISDLKQHSEATRLPITLRVLQVNPAKQFYLNMGFQIEKQTKERAFMRYAPP